MTLIDAFRYSFRGERWYAHLTRLTLALCLGMVVSSGIATLFVGFGYWVSIIEAKTSGDDDLPPFRLRHEGLIALAAFVLYSLAAGGMAYAALSLFGTGSVAASISFIIAVPLYLMFAMGLIRYAVTGNASSFSQIGENLRLLSEHIGSAVVFAVTFILYGVIVPVIWGVVTVVLMTGLAIVTSASGPGSDVTNTVAILAALLMLVIGFVWFATFLSVYVSGMGSLLGQWALDLGFTTEKAKRKNDVWISPSDSEKKKRASQYQEQG